MDRLLLWRFMCRLEWVVALLSVVGGVCVLGSPADTNAVVNADRVSLRGGPSLSSEVLTQLPKGARLVVLESDSAGPAAAWYRIRLPSDTTVWVHADFVDPSTRAVIPQRLNVRAGPGEHHSIVARLARGEIVKEVRVVDQWMEIEPPPSASAYVAARFVTIEGPVPPPAEPVAEAKPTGPAPVPTEPAPVAEAATKSEAVPDPSGGSELAGLPPPIAPGAAPPPAPITSSTPESLAGSEDGGRVTHTVDRVEPTAQDEPPPASEARRAEAPPPIPSTPVQPADAPSRTAAEGSAPASSDSEARPLPRRIVQREGVVVGTTSFQAPTPYKLRSTSTRRDLNYLWPGSDQVRIEPFKGLRVIVTGEEQIEPRWPALPMIEVQKIILAP